MCPTELSLVQGVLSVYSLCAGEEGEQGSNCYHECVNIGNTQCKSLPFHNPLFTDMHVFLYIQMVVLFLSPNACVIMLNTPTHILISLRLVFIYLYYTVFPSLPSPFPPCMHPSSLLMLSRDLVPHSYQTAIHKVLIYTYHDEVSSMVEAVPLKCMYLYEMDQELGLQKTSGEKYIV